MAQLRNANRKDLWRTGTIICSYLLKTSAVIPPWRAKSLRRFRIFRRHVFAAGRWAPGHEQLEEPGSSLHVPPAVDAHDRSERRDERDEIPAGDEPSLIRYRARSQVKNHVASGKKSRKAVQAL